MIIQPTTWIRDPSSASRKNEFKLPAYRNISLLDSPDQSIHLEEGGTIVITSTDFFTSRNNNRGDEHYDRNDCSQLVSPPWGCLSGIRVRLPAHARGTRVESECRIQKRGLLPGRWNPL